MKNGFKLQPDIGDPKPRMSENSNGASVVMKALAIQHPDLVWNFALQHADELRHVIESQALLAMMPTIAANSSDAKRAAELEAYAKQNLPANARQNVDSAIATINQNVKFRTERLPDIDAWLASNTIR